VHFAQDGLGVPCALAAIAGDAQFFAKILHGGGAILGASADLSFGHCAANANVHGCESFRLGMKAVVLIIIINRILFGKPFLQSICVRV
jgi:uncharacterized protein with von Willebrand factor type A (vWA) domain